MCAGLLLCATSTKAFGYNASASTSTSEPQVNRTTKTAVKTATTATKSATTKAKTATTTAKTTATKAKTAASAAVWYGDVPSVAVLYEAFLCNNETKMTALKADLLKKGYSVDEEFGMTYTKSGVCIITFMPGSDQNAVEIAIVDEETKDKFWRVGETFLSNKKGCSIDYWSSPEIMLTKDFE